MGYIYLSLGSFLNSRLILVTFRNFAYVTALQGNYNLVTKHIRCPAVNYLFAYVNVYKTTHVIHFVSPNPYKKGPDSQSDMGWLVRTFSMVRSFYVFIQTKLSSELSAWITSYQCCGSGMFIPDPGFEFFHPRSRSASKNLDIFCPKKLFQSSRKNYLGCLSRIRIFPHPRSRVQKSIGSATLHPTKDQLLYYVQFVLQPPV
jgi:hypothetical protein